MNLSTAGTVYGIVTNESSETLENVVIKVLQDDEEYVAYSGIDEKYEFMGIPPGMCTVSAELEGYIAVSLSDIEVTVSNRTEHNFVLVPE